MPSITVIGSVNLDIVAKAARLPAPGETVTGAELFRYPGGKGANQALAASRLGADVTLIARVGEDGAADEALALLRDGGVELTQCVALEGIPTGTALIAVAPSGENQIVVAPGANRHLAPNDVDVPVTDALICQLEVPVATVAKVASEFTGFLSVNETESAWYGESLRACAGMVATTRGAGRATLEQNGTLIAEAQPPVVKSIDATGAGDTFTAALTVALVEGQEPQDALEFACAAGAVATTKMGAQPSLPMREEVMSNG